MGASSAKSSRPSRSNSSNRMSVVLPRPPKPDPEELERRFTYVLASMNLPPDKARLLRSYDDDRKWDLICDQDRVSAKDSPESYLHKLQLYMDPLDPKNAKNLKNMGMKNLGQTSSTKTLKELEISLRTNHIEWVQQFLNEDNNGLDVLVDYLSQTQEHMRLEQEERIAVESDSRLNSKYVGVADRAMTLRSNTLPKRYGTPARRISTSKVQFGEATDDVHICIMCLRAIMNHQNGFNLIFGHKQAINGIALSLNHRSFRTKTLVLELLAAICLVSGGHEMILSAFDNFKNVCGETHRFETLVRYFRNFEDFHIDFMVACMQFINIIVHSVQDMNFRVHLQHEFTLLGLENILDRLKDTESDRLPVQVNAYLENMVDVQSILEDSDLKATALMQVEDLSLALSHANERLQELDDLYLAKTAQLQEKLSTVTDDRDRLQELCEKLEAEVQQYKDGKISSGTGPVLQQGLSHNPGIPNPPSSPTSAPSAPAPPPPPPPPPAPVPPLLPSSNSSSSMGSEGAPPPPPMAPGFPGAQVVSIKKNIQPKYRLPILNWIAMKPNDVKGTMFSEIDDEKLYKVIDFNQFEECFKIGNLSFDEPEAGAGRQPLKRPEKTTKTLLETNRLRNVAITRRKVDMSDSDIVKAINGLDLKTLSLEWVEILQRIIPNEQEVKVYKEYEKERKPIDQLSDEDRFMISLMKVERLGMKLRIMSFIGNFFETYHHLSPQLNAVYAASKSIRNSKKIMQLFEIILAFGNYMNSCKRGGVYGFKLQSLDMLLEMKSNDKKMSLLQFIVKTIREKFPAVANFEVDFDYIEKAATVSLENILADISELEKDMEMTKKEYEARKDREPPVILKDFLNNSEDKLKKLNHDAKNAREAYTKVVEYFGENPRMIAPSTFFSLFVRFGKAFKQAEVDLENMVKLEEAMLQKATTKNKRQTAKQTQEAVVNELRGRQRQVLNRSEIAHGTLDDLINDIKKNPYRRTDAIHKSFRRNTAESNHQFMAAQCLC